MTEIVEKTLKELKAELVSLGMPEEQADAFNTKAQILSVINTLQAKETVKRVDSLEEVETPKEKKQLEQKWQSKAQQMRDLLMAQPTIRTILPLQDNEQPGVVEWRTDKHGNKYQYHVSGSIEAVQLNGFKYLIPKGTPTDVPQQISETLDRSYLRTMKAGQAISIDRIDERTGRAVSEML